MIEQEIAELHPFMQLSQKYISGEIAADATDIWIANERGRPVLSTTQPVTTFCKVIRSTELGLAEEPTEPTAVISWPRGAVRLYLPDSYGVEMPYESRQWVRGQYDCFSLCADYLHRETDYDIRDLARLALRIADPQTVDSLFIDHPEYANWERVTVPDIGDGIYFNVQGLHQRGNIPNHCGIYMGNGMFMHHFSGRLSCIEALDDQWLKYVTAYVRRRDG